MIAASGDVTFVIVDDDEVDRRAFIRTLRRMGVPGSVVTARDGLEALECLRGDPANDVPPVTSPFVVLLDLNMPRMNGIEFLDELRADEELKRVVVFVVSTSDDTADKAAAYERNVAGYMVKTGAGGDFESAVRLLEHYVKTVRLPGKEH